jgi:hypothetical protein
MSQYGPQFADWVFGLMVVTTALGVVILLVLTIEDWRCYGVSGVVGAIAAILIEPALKSALPAHLASGSVPYVAIPYSLLVFLSCGAGFAALAAAIVRAVLDYFANFRDLVRAAVDSSRWQLGTTPVQLGLKDHVKRWFVTISAATGGVIGSFVGFGVLWDVLYSLRSPRNLLLALVLTAIPLFLSGPLQAYIFDLGANAKTPAEPSKKFSDVLAQGDPLAYGRLAMVIVGYFMVAFLISAVGSRVKAGASEILAAVITAAVTPGIVSYYWCAALQRGAPSVVVAATAPSVITSAVMVYGMALLGIVSFSMGMLGSSYGTSQAQQYSLFLAFSPVIAVVVAVLLSAITTWPFAAAGGHVIDRLPAGPQMPNPMPHVAYALVGAAIVEAAVFAAFDWMVGFQSTGVSFWWPLTMSSAGWACGLFVSGFPQLVRANRK